LSVLEAALPESAAAPYRDQLTALQDSAPPMPTSTVREQLARHLGDDWRDRLVWLDGAPTAAASIGQVHRGRWRRDDGTEVDVAVKVQYPGAGQAYLGDLRQFSRLARGVAPVFPHLDIAGIVGEIEARAADELDYTLEAEAQSAYAVAFADDPEIVVPEVVAVGGEVLVSQWVESPYSLAHVIREGTQAERDHYGQLFARFLFSGPGLTGMLHADPHPGNFRILPVDDGGPGRMAVLDFGAVARLPEGNFPEAMGRLIRVAMHSDSDGLVAGLREEGFLSERTRVDAEQVLDYLAPFVEPARTQTFRFTREWMREQFERINDPKNPSFTLATKLNLPPDYVLIHRTWLGGIGLLSQLGAEAPFRAILTEHLPGFAG
ncbi:MAG: ABC1 kinase family protein, partial [Nocardioides sp.]|uniref:ABC1 kinase family protein n=1 Tax=Nocardioides sp. TaxID=35761 RepID=UPI003F00BB14